MIQPFWEYDLLCCWLKILGKTSLKTPFLLSIGLIGQHFHFCFCQDQFCQGVPPATNYFGNFSPFKKCKNQFGQGLPINLDKGPPLNLGKAQKKWCFFGTSSLREPWIVDTLTPLDWFNREGRIWIRASGVHHFVMLRNRGVRCRQPVY